MKQNERIVLIKTITLLLFLSINSVTSGKINSKPHHKHPPKKVDNKYSKFLSGMVLTLLPKKSKATPDSCMGQPWKFDASKDASRQAENIVVIYQMLDNFDQYLVKDVQKVCKVSLLSSRFFQDVWVHIFKHKKEKKLLVNGNRKRNRKAPDMFEQYGGFKKNTSYANLKLKEAVVYKIFGDIARGPILKKVKQGKPATRLRKIIIDSFAPLSILGLILSRRLIKLFRSQLVGGALVVMECLSNSLSKSAAKPVKAIIKTFNAKIKKWTHETLKYFLTELVCHHKSLKRVIKTFSKITKAQDEKQKWHHVGKWLGQFIKLIGQHGAKRFKNSK